MHLRRLPRQLVEEFSNVQMRPDAMEIEQSSVDERNVRRCEPPPAYATAYATEHPIQSRHRYARRRVYDALNVMIALDIASKDRAKSIHWKGCPRPSTTDRPSLLSPT